MVVDVNLVYKIDGIFSVPYSTCRWRGYLFTRTGTNGLSGNGREVRIPSQRLASRVFDYFRSSNIYGFLLVATSPLWLDKTPNRL